MPSKFRIRNYAQNTTYHISNSGLGKAEIFLDEKDYKKFLNDLDCFIGTDVEILATLLLPNHYHLIVHQKSLTGIAKLMKRVINSYTYYFNNKYKMSGPRFAGKFKSILIPQISLITLTSQYLFSHPGILWLAGNFQDYPYSKFSPTLEFDKKEPSKKELEEIKEILLD